MSPGSMTESLLRGVWRAQGEAKRCPLVSSSFLQACFGGFESVNKPATGV